MSIINPAQIIQHNAELMFRLFADRIWETPLPHILSNIKHPFFNLVMPAELPKTELLELIETIKQNYQRQKQSFCWLVNNTNIDLMHRLDKHGFEQMPGFAGMLCDVNLARLNNEDVFFQEQYHLESILDPSQFNDMLIPLRQAFGFNDEVAKSIGDRFITLLKTQNRYQHFVLYHESRPIACASIYLNNYVAGFYNLAVLPNYRNQGIGSALQRFRLNYAHGFNCQYVILQASGNAENLSKNIGFKKYDYYMPYIFQDKN